MTHVQSQSQEVGSSDEGLGLLCFDLSSAETDFWSHVQSQSQEVGSSDEGLGLLCFDLSSAETDFWWLEDEE